MEKEDIKEKLKKIRQILDECIADLSEKEVSPSTLNLLVNHTNESVFSPDFSLPIRPFIKRYAGNLSGPKKFTLLLARMTLGDLKKEIPLIQIEQNWNKMNSLMGVGFNRFYTQQAKDNGWVDTSKKGFYNLRSSWIEIF